MIYVVIYLVGIVPAAILWAYLDNRKYISPTLAGLTWPLIYPACAVSESVTLVSKAIVAAFATVDEQMRFMECHIRESWRRARSDK